MQHELDNTFETLLRRTAARNRGELLPENDGHLDADCVSAFAENALPDATRALFAAHFADCSDCRQILINFASIQEAEESEIVETKVAASAPPTLSERFARWFALPNLGYAAAALAVLFIGVFAFVALQSRQEKPVQEVAQIEIESEEEKAEKKRRSERPQPVQPEPTVESTPEILPEAMNLTDAGNTNSAENSNQNDEQSPNRGLPPSYRGVIQGQNNGAETAARQREPETQRGPANRATNTSNSAPPANTLAAASPTPAADAASQKAEIAAVAPKPARTPDTAKETADEATGQIAQTQVPGTQNNSARSVTTVRNAVAGRTVAGKTFQKLDGVWRDSNYGGQAPTIVSRSSEEYTKLDGGLRSIADNFKGETVIVVWQGRAYRIR